MRYEESEWGWFHVSMIRTVGGLSTRAGAPSYPHGKEVRSLGLQSSQAGRFCDLRICGQCAPALSVLPLPKHCCAPFTLGTDGGTSAASAAARRSFCECAYQPAGWNFPAWERSPGCGKFPHPLFLSHFPILVQVASRGPQ